METMNRFTIIAERNGPQGDDRVILGVRTIQDGEGYEYVTARCAFRHAMPEPASWYWGHYFRGQGAFEKASYDFLTR
jgi:hypothetical protein